jgi:hypothetical protein
VEFFTEQEARRKNAEDFPKWTKPEYRVHRAHGYTRLVGHDGRERILVYEVELSAKAVSRYESVIRHYAYIREYTHVYWLVGSASVKAAIVKGLVASREKMDNYHQFVDYAEFREKGWNALSTNAEGKTYKTIEGNVRGLTQELPKTAPGVAQEDLILSSHYNPRKCLRDQIN